MNNNSKNFEKGTILKNRYEIHALIGRGGMASTYKAFDKEKGRVVALKILNFQELAEWKELELFEREIRALMHIDHPQIPDYIDHFKTDFNGNLYYVLAQEFIEGSNLQKIIQDTSAFDYTKIMKVTKELLAILKFIHNLHPPIIHRDLNPKNIIINENGTVYLVDFGAVCLKIKNTKTAAKSDTFVGTLGYMSPEQLYGKATPAVDLYALGATILYMLSGKNPQDFSIKKMKLDYKKEIKKHLPVLELVDRLIEPDDKLRIHKTDYAIRLFNKIESEMNRETYDKDKVEIEINNKDNISDTWIEQEINKDKLEKEEKRRIEEGEEEKKQERAKQKEEQKILRQKKKSDSMSNRIKIVEYKDGNELVIKPFPFRLLLWRIKFKSSLFYSISIILTVIFLGVFMDFKALILPLQILSIPVSLSMCILLVIFISALLIRSGMWTIRIRITGGGHVIVYSKNPRKPVFLGVINDMKFELIKNGHDVPVVGDASEFWFDLFCYAVEECIFIRYSIPVKEKDTVRDFLIKHLGYNSIKPD